MAATGQDFELWAGDHKRLIFEVEDLAEEETLSGYEVRWAMSRFSGSNIIIEKKSVDSEIEIGDKTFMVKLIPEDTTQLRAGTYYHEAEIFYDGQYISTVSVGKVSLYSTILK